jgi:putative ABC transport system ATP-binding protein
MNMLAQIKNHHRNLQKDESPPVRESKLIELNGVTKAYTVGSGQFLALKGIEMQVNAGEFVAVVGKSGSGKSTLINMITGIDNPTSGEVFVASTPIHELNQEQLAIWRGKNVGIVFQFFQLLPTLTVAENIVMPMDFCNMYPARERRQRAIALLEKVGIAEQADKLPADLSGGQQQRAAIARALANDPPLLVADEPTGNLDSQTSDAVMQLFADLAAEGKTVVMVTHERDLSRYFTRSILLSDGLVINSQEAQHA